MVGYDTVCFILPPQKSSIPFYTRLPVDNCSYLLSTVRHDVLVATRQSIGHLGKNRFRLSFLFDLSMALAAYFSVFYIFVILSDKILAQHLFLQPKYICAL